MRVGTDGQAQVGRTTREWIVSLIRSSGSGGMTAADLVARGVKSVSSYLSWLIEDGTLRRAKEPCKGQVSIYRYWICERPAAWTEPPPPMVMVMTPGTAGLGELAERQLTWS